MKRLILITSLILIAILSINGQEQKMKNITLTRASVAAGDDFDAPHYKTIEIGIDWKIERILTEIINSKYLPLVAGNATWSVAIDEPIAVISKVYSNSIKLICFPEFPHQETQGFVDIKSIHFNYHAQQDPKIVLDVLKRFDLNK